MQRTAAPGRLGLAEDLARQAAAVTIGDLLVVQVGRTPDRIAVEDASRRHTYAQFNARVNRAVHALAAHGIVRGDRVAILSENRTEYVELLFAAAKLGAILTTLNWRLKPREVQAAILVATPKLIVVSERHAALLHAIEHGAERVFRLGNEWEDKLAAASSREPPALAEPEDGLMLVYTSGTTGTPKGALVSHRSVIARMKIHQICYGQSGDDTVLAWTPLFHVASTDPTLAALCLGGKVVCHDGFNLERMLTAIREEPIWWLVLIPGMLDRLIDGLKRGNVKARGIKLTGAQADLLPPHHIAEISGLLNSPFWNTYGLTECGIPVASWSTFPPGVRPERLSKRVDPYCRYRLVDAEDNAVPDEVPGEFCYRGPAVFLGYWNEPEVNRREFRGGYFHTGDVFRRHADGTIDFVDRVKYMIKSGGENIYPAEIEQVLLSEPRVDDAVVVRRADPQWGEVPVAFVARRDESLAADDLMALCRQELAGYKRPKAIRFVPLDAFPRSTAGKIQRFIVETWSTAPDGSAGGQT